MPNSLALKIFSANFQKHTENLFEDHKNMVAGQQLKHSDVNYYDAYLKHFYSNAL